MVRQARPSITARWVAAQRARLHRSRPSLPDGDPDAELRLYRGFSRAFGIPGLRPTGMALRTRFIDNEVMQATTEGTSQFVLVGAGYDGRALRFRQPGARWFEVDHPATQPDKQRRMSAVAPDAGGITFVPVDLLRDDVGTALANAGHDASQPSLFICEGLFTYLPNAVVSSLCARLRAVAAPRSVLVASVLVVPESGGGIAQRFVNSLLAALGERRLGIFHPGTTESLLQSAGWTVSRRAASADYNASSRRLLLITAEAE